MKRETRWGGQRDAPHPEPVEKVELSEEHVKPRSILAVLLAALAVGSIAYGVVSLFQAEKGWAEITSVSNELNCGEEFTFLYCLGQGDVSATAEKKAIETVYAQATEQAFRLFNNDLEYEDVHNVYYINHHLNENIEVADALYQAFAQVQEAGNRCIYLAPVYAQYNDLFFCADDAQTVDFDPYANPALVDEYAAIAAWARDPQAVDIVLLGNNQIRLSVSEDYRAYAEENAIEDFVDFGWMKNAFIADYLAAELISHGYTNGTLSSYDGFIRNLGGSAETFTYNISHREGGTVYPAAHMEYTGTIGLVCLRDYAVTRLDTQHYYVYADGETRTPYLDPQDGLCKNAIAELVCYARAAGCAEILLQMIPVYIADDFQTDRLPVPAETGIETIYCAEETVFYTDPDLTLTALYDEEDGHYKAIQFR